MYKHRQSSEYSFINRTIGKVVYNSYELRIEKNNELDTIKLDRALFELLVDNINGQKELALSNGGNKVENLVAIFRNSNNDSIVIYFNTKEVKVFNFGKDTSALEQLTKTNYKKVYSECSKV